MALKWPSRQIYRPDVTLCMHGVHIAGFLGYFKTYENVSIHHIIKKIVPAEAGIFICYFNKVYSILNLLKIDKYINIFQLLLKKLLDLKDFYLKINSSLRRLQCSLLIVVSCNSYEVITTSSSRITAVTLKMPTGLCARLSFNIAQVTGILELLNTPKIKWNSPKLAATSPFV